MSLAKINFLAHKKSEEGEKIYHIKTPCKFIIKEEVVKKLKKQYLPEEEIGGIIWVKPKKVGKEYEFIGDNITFIRNAIEDKPNERGKTRKNAYLPDRKQRTETLQKIFKSKYLPIEFHSHPTKGSDFLTEFLEFNYQRDTSEQDKKVAQNPLTIGKEKLLLPQALIVGNSKFKSNFFIGIYSGFIAPKGFKETREEVVKENMDKAYNAASNIELTDNQKIFTGLAILALFLVIIKIPSLLNYKCFLST